MKTEDLLREIESLPVEERARVADSLLKSLNPPESEIDKKWAEVARRRLDEVQSGTVKPISGDEVFEAIWKRC
ncbi:MAG: addiction module protein [Nitrosomonas sp.]|jgi:putative addiction module component (TIGR02574 family)|nr:addiction module protein [Nitrosomonas sp.]